MVKNVIIINDFDYIQGGASKVAIDTANLLVESFSNLNVYFFSGDSKEDSILNNSINRISTFQGENLKDKNKIRGFFNNIYNFKAKNELKNLLEKLDSSKTIIHVHGWTKCLSSSVFDIAFKMNFKVVLTLHDYFTACPNGGFFNYSKNKICTLKPLSRKCICCNCDSRNYGFKLYRVLRQFVQNKIVKLNKKLNKVIYISDLQWNVLGNYFNSDIQSEKILNPIEQITSDYILDHNKNNYFLYVGRVSKEKDVLTFCKACTKLGVKGIVVGDGSEKETLQNEYPNIEFCGWKTKEDVTEYMLKAKALVFPSLWYEGAPLTVEEALNLHLPCIVSDASSATEKIIDGKNGYIFKTSDVEDLVSKMEKIKKIKYELSHKSSNSFEYINNIINFYNK